MILLFLFYIVVATEDKGRLERWVFLHEETKILLAEKFVNAKFLVPYPQFDIQSTESLDRVARELQNMLEMAIYRCYLNFTNTSENEFKVDWLLKERKKEISFADKDLNKMKHEVSSFLKGTEIKKKRRSKRALPPAAVVAGAVGLFGTGIMFGAWDDCGIMGIFGSCQEKALNNAKKVERIWNSHWRELTTTCKRQKSKNSFLSRKTSPSFTKSKIKLSKPKLRIGNRFRNNSKYSERIFTTCVIAINYIHDSR